MTRLTAAEVEAKNAKNRAAHMKPLHTVSDRNLASWPIPQNYTVAKVTQAGKLGKFRDMSAIKKRKTCPTESQEQIALIAWCDTQPLARYMFAIPNGANKSMAAAIKFKREGLRKGYPDLGLDIAHGGFHGLRIELKRRTGSVTSPEQREWISFLHQAGYAAFVCRGADEAIKVIQEYLK